MATIRVTQARNLATTSAGVSSRFDVSQSSSLAAVNFPTDQINASQNRLDILVDKKVRVDVPQAHVMVLVTGRPVNRSSRAWTFSLDGHDFYVLRIGEDSTLVYDTTTGQWATWLTDTRKTWRAHLGTNWIGAQRNNYLGGMRTQVIAGDDTFGTLWSLDPVSGNDDAPVLGRAATTFPRIVTGGLPMRERKSPRCSAVFLTASVGAPSGDATILLRTSDDYGQNWQSQGSVTLVAGNFAQELSWRSLGLIRAPGRIFEFSDTGAAVRIDGADARLSGENTK